jgi:hypothetical protein
VGETQITAWTHRACLPGMEAAHMAAHGWRAVPIPGRTWRSGAPRLTWTREPGAGHQLDLWAAAPEAA